MDEFTINVSSVTIKKDKEVIELLDEQDSHMTVTDQGDGTYVAQFTFPRGGAYEISILFEGIIYLMLYTFCSNRFL